MGDPGGGGGDPDLFRGPGGMGGGQPAGNTGGRPERGCGRMGVQPAYCGVWGRVCHRRFFAGSARPPLCGLVGHGAALRRDVRRSSPAIRSGRVVLGGVQPAGMQT